MDEIASTAKRPTRIRKTTVSQTAATPQDTQAPVTGPVNSPPQIGKNFDELVAKLSQNKQEFDNLQKEIAVKVIESGSTQTKPQISSES